MKFRCERETLVEAFAAASRAAKRGGRPALEGVRCDLAGDRLELTGTDLDLTIRVEIEVAGAADGVAVIPARLGTDIFRSLQSGAVEVVAEDSEVRISSGRAQFSVRTQPADEFPVLAEPTGTTATLDAPELRRALEQVVLAASKDEHRPILTGVLFAAEEGGLRLVATDSYRLAIRDLPGVSLLGDDQRPLVPSRALSELVRFLGDVDEVDVTLGEQEVSFSVDGVLLSTRLLVGEFPNYQQLIPSSYPNRLTVAREELRDAIARVKLLTHDNTPIRLSMSSTGLELTVVSQERGEAHESLDAKFEGTDLEVAFNPDYLLEGIGAIDGDEVVVETLDPHKPATVQSTGAAGFLYLLMPVRVT